MCMLEVCVYCVDVNVQSSDVAVMYREPARGICVML